MSSYNINKFYKKIYFKKQYLKKMQNKIYFINKIKHTNFKKIGSSFLSSCLKPLTHVFVMYIIEVYFSKKNTLFHLSDCLGNIKIFYSASVFQQKKMFHSTALQKFYKILVSKLKFCKKVPIAVHFKNVDFNIFRFLKKLKKKFFIPVEKYFSKYSYNGCKKKKIRKKKIKSKFLSIMKKWLSGLKRQIVNLLGISVAGSNPAFFN